MPKFPFCKQLYAMDCGAACIKMAAEHYGKHPDMDFIREHCRVGAEGVSFKGICSTLETLGFRTLAGKVDASDLRTKALLPCILHWDQNHFVVLIHVRRRRGRYTYRVADPGTEVLEYAEQEFLSHWLSSASGGVDKGNVILFEPRPDFARVSCPQERGSNASRKKRTNFLWAYFRDYRRYFLQMLLELAVCGLVMLASPFLTQSIVDIGIGQRSLPFILLVLIGQTLLLFGRTIIDFVQNRLLLHIGARINISLLSDFFVKLLRLPMGFFDTRLSGDILQRIEDHRQIQQALTSESIGLAFSGLVFVVFGTVLCIYSPAIFGIFLFFAIMYGLWLTVFLKRRRRLNYKQFEQQALQQSTTVQLVSSAQETKIHGAQDRKRWEWEDVQADIFETRLQLLKLEQTQDAGGIFISELRNILITVSAAAAVMAGDITLGVMVSIQFILGGLSSPVERIMGFIHKWQDVQIALGRIATVHLHSEEDTSRPVITFPTQDRSLHIRGLSFRYPGIREEYVLDGIDLDIPEGKTTAIVGGSGSGKSTLVKLLLGYYNNYEGEIRVGDADLRKVCLEWWRSRVGAVMQNGFIYADTIAGNIAVAEMHPDIGRLRHAAHLAQADQFIESLPLAYNTKVGEGGMGLSQGQKQRILIARAVYKDPEYLFLDEATNSLDAHTERDITAELDAFYKGRTSIVVAHRLSTVRGADQIVVLGGGRIVEQGTHAELTQLRGAYYGLVKNQLELGT